MNVDEVMSKMMDTHKKSTKTKNKKLTKSTKRFADPIEKLDPENDSFEQTLVKLCNYVEWLKQEIHEIREDLEVKSDISSHNNLSLKVDQIETSLSDLSMQIDYE